MNREKVRKLHTSPYRLQNLHAVACVLTRFVPPLSRLEASHDLRVVDVGAQLDENLHVAFVAVLRAHQESRVTDPRTLDRKHLAEISPVHQITRLVQSLGDLVRNLRVFQVQLVVVGQDTHQGVPFMGRDITDDPAAPGPDGHAHRLARGESDNLVVSCTRHGRVQVPNRVRLANGLLCPKLIGGIGGDGGHFF